jgi:hypothetical protein
VISQQVAIEVGPLEQVPLLVVVSDQGNVLFGRHWQNVMFFQYDNYPSVIFARQGYTLVNRQTSCSGNDLYWMLGSVPLVQGAAFQAISG